MKPKSVLCRAAALLAAVTAAPVYAWDAMPAYNQGTLARSFALPIIGESVVSGRGQFTRSFDYDLTTEYYADNNASENLVVDGETSMFTLGARYGIGHNLELSARVPVLVVGGGFMDHFIEQWHKTFGLPNGGREYAARDQRQYRYVRNGVTVLDEQGGSGTSLGDVQLGAGWQLSPGVALRGAIKLPTGRESRLTGGNWGGALWSDLALPFASDSTFDGFASLGVTVAQRSDVLRDQQRNAAIFGGTGVGYQLTTALQLRGQIYAHSALYRDSELDGLRKPGLQLSLGGSYRATPGVRLDLFFQEDAVTNSSPDFSLHLGASWR